MKKLVIFFPLIATTWAWCATPARMNGGQIEFAFATVGAQVCWTKAERDAAVAVAAVFSATSPTAVVNFTPTAYETALSTSATAGLISFSNIGEFNSIAGTKGGILDKLNDPNSTRAQKIKEATDFLKSEDAKK